MVKYIKRAIFIASITIGAVAVFEQLSRPKEQRTWYGDVFGVPYDFRPPSPRRFKERWWNPDDPRLFTPRDFGVGWSLNLARIYAAVTTPAKTNGDG